MKTNKVIYRTEHNPYTGKWECIALFPEFPANLGRIVYYHPNEGWGECDIEYYYKTKKAKPEDYAELHKYLLNEFEHPTDGEEPETLIVRQNIRKDMTDKAWSLRKAN